MNVHAAPAAKATPALPSAKPESIGLSPLRLERMRDAFQREIDKGTTPGVVTMVARRGQIGWFEAQGRQDPAADAPMAKDSIFRIFSMTKPLVSLGIMMLVEDGELLLNDPLAKFIPEFASQKVGIERNGAYIVRAARATPLGPGWLWAFIGIALLMIGWRRESA